jgi:hypothetical protein
MCHRYGESISYDKNKNYTGILKRSKRYVAACLAAFLLAVFLGGSVLMAAEPNENTTQRAVDSFLTQSAKGEITRIELYYLSWNALTRYSITEKLLRDDHYDCKVIVKYPKLSELEKSMREIKFENIDGPINDYRWGCVFYAKNEEVLRLFSPNGPMVAINGVGYKATPELIRSLMQFLPVEAYKEMNEFIVKNWAPSWQILSKQQTTLNEKKESDKH